MYNYLFCKQIYVMTKNDIDCKKAKHVKWKQEFQENSFQLISSNGFYEEKFPCERENQNSKN